MKSVSLAEVCTIKPSKAEARKKLQPDDMVSFVPMQQLGELTKAIELNGAKLLSEVQGSYTYFAEGDVLMAKITPCFENGKLGIARGLENGVGFGSSEFVVLRPSERILADYLWYFLSQDWIRETGKAVMTGAVGHKRIPPEFTANLQIPLPSLDEQRRIVAILDEAFAGIATATANAEKNLANARELLKSTLADAFNEGTDSTPLQDLCLPDRVITYGVIKLGDEVPGGVPCLRTSNVRWLGFDQDGLKRISPSLSQEYRRTILAGGEVLVNVRGTLGGVAVASEDMRGWNVSREVAVVPCDPAQVDPRYLAYWIGTPISQKWLTGVLKGLAYTGINISDLRTLSVPVCSMPEQQELADRLDSLVRECRRLEASYHAKLSKLEALRESLLARAFSGELTGQPEAVAA